MSDQAFDTSDVDSDGEDDDGVWDEPTNLSKMPQEPEPSPLDLNQLHDLLELLTKFNVRGFEIPNLSLVFHETSEEERAGAKLTAEQKAQEDQSTSSKPVSGFSDPRAGLGFRNPLLWQGTNGKRLTLSGDLE